MKVLFCTPYLTGEDIVLSGIGVWANNILDYYKSIDSDVKLIPVSFDRRYKVSGQSSTLDRLLYGVRDYWRPIKTAMDYMSRGKIDVLHLCSSAQLSLYKDLYVLKMARRKGIKTTIHFHFGRIPELLKLNNNEAKNLRRVCQAADMIIVMDQRSHDALCSEGFANVYNLPNPLSIEVMENAKSLGGSIARVENRVIYVGHIIPSKGITELVKACTLVDGIELHMIGTITDEYLRELQGIANGHEDGTWLKYRGKMPHDMVIREMLTAGIFCLPSYTEGFPNVILESMACGCSIIATPVGAIPEMLQFEHNNKCGVKVDVKSVESIVKALNVFGGSQKLTDMCRSNAVMRVNQLYAVPVIWKQLETIWNSML